MIPNTLSYNTCSVQYTQHKGPIEWIKVFRFCIFLYSGKNIFWSLWIHYVLPLIFAVLVLHTFFQNNSQDSQESCFRRTRSATPSSACSPTWQPAKNGSNNSLLPPGELEAAQTSTTTSPRPRELRVSVPVVSRPEDLAAGASLLCLGGQTSRNQARGTLWDKPSADQFQPFTESINCAQREIYFDQACPVLIQVQRVQTW